MRRNVAQSSFLSKAWSFIIVSEVVQIVDSSLCVDGRTLQFHIVSYGVLIEAVHHIITFLK